MADEPLISVLIPAYNSAAYLPRCLSSVLRQTYRNLDIVVLNDGSTDGTQDVLDRFAAQDARIRPLCKANEASLSKTRNALLDAVRGEYFVFIDSDDYVEKRFVARLYETLHATGTDLSMCNFRMQFFPFPLRVRRHPRQTSYAAEDCICRMVLGRELHFMLWNKLFRSDLAAGLRFDPAVRYGEDLIFCYRYFKRCRSVSYTAEPLYHYVSRNGSEMRQKLGDKHFTLLDGLEGLLAEETDAELASCLRAWIGFSSCLMLMLAHTTGYRDPDGLRRLSQNAVRNEDALLHHRATRRAYKVIYRTLNFLHHSEDRLLRGGEPV